MWKQKEQWFGFGFVVPEGTTDQGWRLSLTATAATNRMPDCARAFMFFVIQDGVVLSLSNERMARIFITGVSAGIGKALADEYLAQGSQVYGISRRTPHDLVVRPNFRFRSVDLCNSKSIAPALRELTGSATNFDVVILNAAGIGKIGDLKDIDTAEFERLMQLNVWSNKIVLDTLFSICSSVTQVVAVSSCAAIAAFRGTPCYCISKASLNMLIALYAEERKETHFSVIAPGLVDTEMQQQISAEPQADKFASLVYLKTMHGGGCMMPPRDAADALIRTFADARAQKSGAFIDASNTMSAFPRGLRGRQPALQGA